MIEGFDYDNLITIGFLNENMEERLEMFKEKFDIVLINDESFDFINELIKDLS